METKENQRVLLLVDFEGVIGLKKMTPIENVRELVYREIEYVVLKLKASGYSNISVCNIHDKGTDLDEKVLQNLNLVLLQGVYELLDAIRCGSFSISIMIGFHGMCGTDGAFAHSFRSDIKRVLIGNEEIGEVGMFVRLLSLHGIPVVFVAGVGIFEQEIIEYPITTVSTENYSLIKYGKALEFALKNKPYPIMQVPIEEVFVEIDNPDKYYITKDYPFLDRACLRYKFPGIDVFFENIYGLADILNQASCVVRDVNYNFVKWLKRQDPNIHDKKHLLIEFLGKDILQITRSDRAQIAERSGLDYESFNDYY